MTWIRVHCSNGARYSAPSFATPPTLEGFDTLFASAEVGLRGVSCFPIRYPKATTVAFRSQRSSDAEETDPAECVSVLFSQVSLGAPLGIATVAAGSTSGDTSESELRSLLEYVEIVLRSTNTAGVRALLDAICTLTPAPRDPYEEVLERDGLDVGVEDEEGGDGRHRGRSGNGSRYKNRAYLRNLLPSASSACGGTEGSECDSPGTTVSMLSTASMFSSTSGTAARQRIDGGPLAETAMRGDIASGASSRGLPPVDGMRRRAHLRFLSHRAVPLSLLFSQVHASYTLGDANGTCSGKPRRSSAAASLHIFYNSSAVSCLPAKFAGAPRTRPSRKSASSSVQSAHTFPAAATACATSLLRAIQSMLEGAASIGSSSRNVEGFAAYALWQETQTQTQTQTETEKPKLQQPPTTAAGAPAISIQSTPNCTPTPTPAPDGVFVATFSPSGLLLASPQWWTRLSATSRLLLSATAIDAMTRGGKGEGANPAGLLHTTLFPFRIPTATSVAGAGVSGDEGIIADVCFLTIGDTLSFVFGFPRRGGHDSFTPRAEGLLMYITGIQQAVTPAAFPPAEDLMGGGGSLFSSTLRALRATTHPPTPDIDHALFAANSLTAEAFVDAISQHAKLRPPVASCERQKAAALGSVSALVVAAAATSTTLPRSVSPAGAAPLYPGSRQPSTSGSKTGKSFVSCILSRSAKRGTSVHLAGREQQQAQTHGVSPSPPPSPPLLLPAVEAPSHNLPVRRKRYINPSPAAAVESTSMLGPSDSSAAVKTFLRWCHLAVTVAQLEREATSVLESTPAARAYTFIYEEGHHGRCIVSLFRPLSQERFSTAGSCCARSQLTAPDLSRLDALFAGDVGTILLPASALVPTFIDKAESGSDSSSDSDPSDAEEDDDGRAMLTCLLHAAQDRVASRKGSTYSRSAMVCLQGSFLDAADVIHRCLEWQEAPATSSNSASKDLPDEKKAEVTHICEGIVQLTHAAEALAKSAFAVTASTHDSTRGQWHASA